MAKTKENKEEQLELVIEESKSEKDSANAKKEGDDTVQVTKKADVVDEDEAGKKLKEVQDRLTAADKERDELRIKNQNLQKQQSESNTRAETAEARQIRTQKEQIENFAASAEFALTSAKREYKAALEAGNSELATDLAEKISDAKFDVRKAADHKAQFENWEKQQEEIAKRPKAQEFPASVTKWMNDNPEYKTNPKFRAEADGAHATALALGYGFGSSAYIDFVDGRVKKKDEAKVVVNKEEDTRTVSAPPSRSTGESRERDSNDGEKITIPKSIMPRLEEYARINNMTPAEYAKGLKEDGNLQSFIDGTLFKERS